MNEQQQRTIRGAVIAIGVMAAFWVTFCVLWHGWFAVDLVRFWHQVGH